MKVGEKRTIIANNIVGISKISLLIINLELLSINHRMFLEFINFLTQFDSGFNVLQYLTLRAILAMLMSLFTVLALGRLFINRLQQYQVAQIIRHNGPESHLSKAGTPTMGGVLILLSLLVACWYGAIYTMFIFGLWWWWHCFWRIGFVDDYLKISKKSAHGLSAKQKYWRNRSVQLRLRYG
ncbi:Phospho-N-acetylmuramoyl-pentapeptide-transferase (EC [uncultured Gammaproteobacteria bacterium]|nr:Phospho-N-acetylmuramoyl-pentapeptide-transferase (EC [uncultured Gammaproteobacteria bacterium]